MKSDFSVQNNVVNVCCSYLSMVFSHIENVKYPHGRTGGAGSEVWNQVYMIAPGKKIFWDHFSKSLVTIQVFTSETWAPTRLKNGGKCDCLCDCDL